MTVVPDPRGRTVRWISPGEPRARRRENALQGSAIIHLDGSERLRDRRWPREVAIEFLSGSPDARDTLSWLVASEAFWPRAHTDGIPASNGDPSISPGPGQGAPVAQVARELMAALEGHKVYAEAHLVVGRWMNLLFDAAGLGAVPFKVRDLRVLADLAKPTSEDIVAARCAAENVAGLAWRAPCEAIRHAEFVRTLTARHMARTVSARWNPDEASST